MLNGMMSGGNAALRRYKNSTLYVVVLRGDIPRNQDGESQSEQGVKD